MSTYPFQATRPLSVLFSIDIQVLLSAAIEIARGGRCFGLKKRTLPQLPDWSSSISNSAG